MASVVVTLPAISSRNPHQGSSFVTANEIELWNECNMMHGSKDAVRHSRKHRPAPRSRARARRRVGAGRVDEPEDDAGDEGRHADVGPLPQHPEQEPAEEELLGERRDHAGHEPEGDQAAPPSPRALISRRRSSAPGVLDEQRDDDHGDPERRRRSRASSRAPSASAGTRRPNAARVRPPTREPPDDDDRRRDEHASSETSATIVKRRLARVAGSPPREPISDARPHRDERRRRGSRRAHGEPAAPTPGRPSRGSGGRRQLGLRGGGPCRSDRGPSSRLRVLAQAGQLGERARSPARPPARPACRHGRRARPAARPRARPRRRRRASRRRAAPPPAWRPASSSAWAKIAPSGLACPSSADATAPSTSGRSPVSSSRSCSETSQLETTTSRRPRARSSRSAGSGVGVGAEVQRGQQRVDASGLDAQSRAPSPRRSAGAGRPARRRRGPRAGARGST